MTTRAEAIADAGLILAQARAELASRDPHSAALAAWHDAGPSVVEIENDIRASRGLPLIAQHEGAA